MNTVIRIPAIKTKTLVSSRNKTKTLVSSPWVLFNRNGERKFLDLDKYSILRRLRIHARDLKILDPLLSYPSTIMGRERAIIVNLKHIKAIITAEEVLLRDPSGENVIPVVEELQRRLALPCAPFEGQGDQDEQGGTQNDTQFGEEHGNCLQRKRGYK